jgi:Secretion system C-terminal sorting domain
MKKVLLAFSVYFGFMLTANAQLTFSFEESEGFETGSIVGQSDFWGIFTDTDPMYVSEENSTEGINALKFEAPVTDGIEYTGGYLYFNNPYTNFSVSQDILGTSISETANDFTITGLYYNSTTQTYTTASILYFYYGSGGLYVFYGDGTTDYELIGSFDPEVWMNVKTVYDVDTASISYYINDELVYTSDFYDGEGVAVNMMQYITGAGDSAWYIDNIVVQDESVAAVKSVAAKGISVYPNPATDVINVANGDALLSSITVADVNGRVVKNASFSSVTEAQVNIADLASGVYVVTIHSDKGTTTKKVVKN